MRTVSPPDAAPRGASFLSPGRASDPRPRTSSRRTASPAPVRPSSPATLRSSPLRAFRRSAPGVRATRATAPRPRPVLSEPRTPTRARGRAGHGRVGAEHRTRLGDIAAGLAAGAGTSSVLALVLLPGLPAGVALAAGAIVSVSGGALVLLPWSRSAVRDGASPAAVRRHAILALVGAHAAAAVPVGLAVLLAG